MTHKTHMIDWFRGSIYLHHLPLKTGCFIEVDKNGDLIRSWSTRNRIDGSYSSSIRIHSDVSPDRSLSLLEIDGNLVKFLQGHNIIGTDDLITLLSLFLKRLVELKIIIADDLALVAAYKKIALGLFFIKMFDINYLFDLGSHSTVESFITSLSSHARTRSSPAVLTAGTVYLQKHSRRWAFKFYNKYSEAVLTRKTSRRLHDDFKELGDWSKGKVRVELRLMSLELKDLNIKDCSDLIRIKDYNSVRKHFRDDITSANLNIILQDRIRELFWLYLGRVVMNLNIQLTDDVINDFPPSIKSSYFLYKEGYNLVSLLSRSSFYRHRKFLLDFGIDISLITNLSGSKDSNVIPLIRRLEAIEVLNPDRFNKFLVC